MQRPGAAKGEEREIARIGAQRHRDHADRPRHPHVRHAQHRRRGLHRVQPQGRPQTVNEDSRHVRQRHPAFHARHPCRVQPAQKQVGIRDRRFAAATPVADRPGIGPGALRSHLQQPGGVDPGDRAATRAHGAHVDHRNMDRHRVFDLGLVADRRLRPPDQRHVGRGAAHVVGDQIRHPGHPPGMRRRHHARGRSAHHRLRRLLGHPARRHHAAIAVHHEQLPGIAAPRQLGLQLPDIPRQKRLDRGVHRGRHPALEFPAFRQQRMAQRDEIVRPDLPQQLCRAQFMRRVGISMQEMHHHRLAPRRQQRPPRLAHRVIVKRRHHPARRIHPLRHFQPQVARDDRAEGAGHAVGLRPRPPPKLQHVAEPLRGDQPGARKLALQHRVGGGRGAVHDQIQRRQIHLGRPQRIQHTVGLVAHRARHLGQPHRAGRGVDLHQIGEGTADIDADQLARAFASHALAVLLPAPRMNASPRHSVNRLDCRWPRRDSRVSLRP